MVNLYCNPCKRAFETINRLLAACKNNIDLQVLVLGAPDKPENEITKAALHLLALAEQQPVNEVREALFYWFQIVDYKLWSTKYPATITEQHIIWLKNHVKWLSENKIEGTPTFFLNHKKIPSIIDIEDIIYLVSN
jgi:protein-disulfide isomerase